jgi:hypothetical protein
MNGSMKKVMLPLVAVAALVAACVPSVNPFYTDKDVITDPRLLGTWLEDVNQDRPSTWKFEASTNNAYAVSLMDGDGKTGDFEGHLFKLGAGLFLDLTPADCDYATNQAGLVGVAMIPGHLLARVTLTPEKLTFAICDPDWTKKFLEQNPSALAHRVVNDELFFTAETDALQKFVLQHLGKGELFGDDTVYKRQPDAATK